MTVTAGYRFIPIHRAIYTPPWGHLASQDVPFADGLDGSIGIKITTLTPTCVGGRRIPNPDNSTTVEPFMLPDGRFAIPRSSLEGMLRSILERAAFGRVGHLIEKRWPGIRDLGNSATAARHYRDRFVKTGERLNGCRVFKPQTRGGWIKKTEEGAKLMPAELCRLEFNQLIGHYSLKGTAEDNIIQGDRDAPQRYEALGVSSESSASFGRLNSVFSVDNGPKPVLHRDMIKVDGKPQNAYIFEANAKFSDTGTAGTVVITGKPKLKGNPMSRGKKKKEFVFHSPSRSEAETRPEADWTALPADTWAAFLEMNADAKGEPTSPAWAFWQKEWKAGRPLPVFWLEPEDDAGGVAALGMAFMFKAPFGQSTHDLLRNSSPDHLAPPSPDRKPDLPDIIFGEAALMHGDGRTSGGRGRAAFETAIGPNESEIDRNDRRATDLTLTSPKLSYYPNYVRQPEDRDKNDRQLGDRRQRDPMAVYAAHPEAKDALVRTPELGQKVFPAGDGAPRSPAEHPEDLKKGDPKTITRVAFLPKNCTFTTRLHFHNLRPQELGALFWALTMGLQEDVIHRLGHAKGLGYGEVAIAIDDLDLVGEEKTLETDLKSDCIRAFETEMVRFFQSHLKELEGETWLTSPQIRGLRRAATRNDAALLKYMTLDQHAEVKKYQKHLIFDTRPGKDREVAELELMAELIAEIEESNRGAAEAQVEAERPPEIGERGVVMPGRGVSGYDHKEGEVIGQHGRRTVLFKFNEPALGTQIIKKKALRRLPSA